MAKIIPIKANRPQKRKTALALHEISLVPESKRPKGPRTAIAAVSRDFRSHKEERYNLQSLMYSSDEAFTGNCPWNTIQTNEHR
jgi:hypothetical protein